jgi:hypothetical protein
MIPPSPVSPQAQAVPDAGAVLINPMLEAGLERILARTKIDRTGAYWPLSRSLRDSASALECTLALGHGGILLTLLHYYRHTRYAEDELRDVLSKGLAWLRHRLKKSPFRHGFYGGTSGTWYVLSEVERDLPELVEGWRDAARRLLSGVEWEGDLPGGLVEGVSGTLLGLCLLPERLFENSHWTKLESHLLAGAKPHPDGLFWDFQPTSLHPPVGLLSGSAGVDLVLARGAGSRRSALFSVLAGSIGYADRCFSEELGNWPDFEASRALRALDRTDLERRVAIGKVGDLVGSIAPEDSIGWATGTVGILQSRALVRRHAKTGGLAARVEADCGWAIERLGRLDSQALADLDSSLAHGVNGIALGLRASRSLLRTEEWQAVAPVFEAASQALATSSPRLENEDLSLFSGLAGQLYAQIVLARDAKPDCVAVLNEACISAAQAEFPEPSLGPFLQRRLPVTASSAEQCDRIASLDRLSLGTIREVIANSALQSDNLKRQAVAHELGLYEDLAGCRFQDLLWRELALQHNYALRFAEDGETNLLFARLRLSPAVKLFAFPFDPFARPFSGAAETVHALRHATSGGVIEIRLTSLQSALLESFQSDEVVITAINKVVERVEHPNVSQRQLAKFSKKVVRSFLQAGYLVPANSGRLRSVLDRRRFRAVQRRLFPQSEV